MTTSTFASLPAPPYYSVIFSSQRTSGESGYGRMHSGTSERLNRFNPSHGPFFLRTNMPLAPVEYAQAALFLIAIVAS
jgi:hypothetical protein